MTGNDLSTQLKARLYPKPYDVDISPSGSFDFVIQSKALFANGKYVVGFKQLTKEISFDQFLDIRSEAQKLIKSMWLFREKGIYLIICGPEKYWKKHTEMIVADKTGLHSLIVNAVHFIDPENSATHLSSSSWGSLEFGDVRLVSSIIEEELKNNSNQSLELTRENAQSTVPNA